MAEPLYFNGRFTTTAERVIGVEDRGFQFGDAIYEVVKFVSKRPLFLREHFQRLHNGIDALAIGQPWSDLESFEATCSELLARTVPDDGLIYVQVTRGECTRSHFYPPDIQPTVVAYTRSWKFPDASRKATGMRVVTAPDSRWDHCNVKSVNLLGNVLAKQLAMKAGVDETIMIRDGVVTEGASVSFFGVRDGVVKTHPANKGILPGTVRDHVIAIAGRDGVPLDEEPISIDAISRLTEAFVTATTLGVMPVVEIDGQKVGDGTRGAITSVLQTSYDRLEESASKEASRDESRIVDE